jgi:hypothetical protein
MKHSQKAVYATTFCLMAAFLPRTSVETPLACGELGAVKLPDTTITGLQYRTRLATGAASQLAERSYRQFRST